MKTAIFTKVFGERRLDDIIDIAADLNYDAVELMCREPHFGVETSDQRAHDLKAQLDTNDLDVSCLATYTGKYIGKSDEDCEQTLRRLTRFLELAEIMECPRIRHGPGGPPSREATDEDFQSGAKWMRRAADLAAEYDTTLLIEIHSNRIVESATDAKRLLSMIDRDNVGVIHDAGNMYISDVAYGHETITQLGDALQHVHVKDELRRAESSFPGSFELETRHGSEVFEPRLLGTGAVDHGSLFEALAERDYNGYVTAECHRPTDNEMDAVAIARHERTEMERLWEQAQAE